MSRPPWAARARPSLSTLVVWALYAAAPFVIFSQELVAGAFLDGGDDVLSNLPYQHYSIRALLRGEIFWTPQLWMGAPALEEPELATFYPFRLALLFLPPAQGIAFTLVLHYVLAQGFAYHLGRTLGMRLEAAFFLGLALGFAGFMVGHRGHLMYVTAGAWTPLFLLCLERAFARRPGLWPLAGALVLALIPLSGAFQLTYYLALLAIAYALLMGARRGRYRPLFVALGTVAGGLLLAAPQILPSVLYSASLVNRREDFAYNAALSFPPLRLPSIAIGNGHYDAELWAFAGTSVCVAAVYAVCTRWREARVRAWALIAVGALLLMLGRYVPRVPELLHQVPLVNVFRGPARHGYELGVALAILGAYGVDARELSRASLRRLAPLAVGGLLLATLLASLGAWLLAQPEPFRVRGGWTALAALVALGALAALTTRRHRWAFAALLAMELAHALSEWDGRPIAAARQLAQLPLEPEPDEAPVRVLGPTVVRGEPRYYSGNTALLAPGVSHLHGYASMAPEDSTAILDLDEFGVPRDLTDLTFGPLPSIFGVTHVFGPVPVCGGPTLRLAAGGGCAAAPGSAPLEPRRALACRRVFTDGALRAELETEAPHVVVRNGLEPTLQVEEERFEPTPGRALARAHLLAGLRLDPDPDAPGTLRFRTFDRAAELGGVTLRSEGGERARSLLARLPSSMLRFSLTTEGAFHGPLVLDLYHGAARYDPDEGQVVVLGDGRDVLREAIVEWTPGTIPDGAELRLFLEGTGEARVSAATVQTQRPRAVWQERMAARGVTRVRLPQRPYRVQGTLRIAGTAAAPVRPFAIWLRVPDDQAAPRAAHEVKPDRFHGGVARIDWVTEIPASAKEVELVVEGLEAATVELEASPACGAGDYEVLRRVGERALFRNHRALPRAYVADRVRVAGSPREVVRALRDRRFVPGREVVLEAPPEEALVPGARVVRTRFGTEWARAVVDAPDGPTLLVLNERYDARWQATLDGRPVPVLRANGLVRGVLVPRGRHTVAMRMVPPPSLAIGLGLAALGLAFVILAPPLAPRLARLAGRAVRRAAGLRAHLPPRGRRVDRATLGGLALLALAALALPLRETAAAGGLAAWDLPLFLAEAGRRAVLAYGELPLSNPWLDGGVPLLGDPRSAVLAPSSLLVLALGAPAGLTLATLLFLAAGLAGAYRLARAHGALRLPAAIAALLFALGPLAASVFAGGELCLVAFGLVPLALLAHRRALEEARFAVVCGALLAWLLLEGAAPLALLALLWMAATSATAALRGRLGVGRAVGVLGTALGVALALGAVKLLPTLEVLTHLPWREPRPQGQGGFSLGGLLEALLEPAYDRVADTERTFFRGTTGARAENLFYLGPVALLLATLGALARGRNVANLIACAVLLWATLGERVTPSLSRLLAELPALGPLVAGQRARFLLGLGLALLAARGAQRLLAWSRGKAARRAIVLALLALAVVDPLLVARAELTSAPAPVVVDAPRRAFSQVDAPPREGVPASLRARLAANEGALSTPTPLAPRDRVLGVRPRGAPGYRGEAWLESGEPLRRTGWSPSTRSFARAGRGPDTLVLNERAWPGWEVEGGRVSPRPDGLLAVRVDGDTAQVRLRYRPLSFRLGAGLSALGILLALALWRRLGPRA